MHDHEGVTDSAAVGEALFNAAKSTEDPVLQADLDAQLNYLLKNAPRAADGTLFHVIDTKEMWVDSMFMAPEGQAFFLLMEAAWQDLQ